MVNAALEPLAAELGITAVGTKASEIAETAADRFSQLSGHLSLCAVTHRGEDRFHPLAIVCRALLSALSSSVPLAARWPAAALPTASVSPRARAHCSQLLTLQLLTTILPQAAAARSSALGFPWSWARCCA